MEVETLGDVQPLREVESLKGLSPDEAERMVREAGYTPRTIGHGRPGHANYRPNRITLWLGADGKVRAAVQS
jgi:hypothetical protein